MGPFVLRSEPVSSTVDFLLGLIQYLMEYLIRCDIEAPNEVATESYLRLAKKGLLAELTRSQAHSGDQEWAARSRIPGIPRSTVNSCSGPDS